MTYAASLQINNLTNVTYTDNPTIDIQFSSDSTNLLISIYSTSSDGQTTNYTKQFTNTSTNFTSDINVVQTDAYTNLISATISTSSNTNSTSIYKYIFSTPKVSSYKTLNITAPTDGGYLGNDSDHVPGAARSITIFVTNYGQVPIKNLKIYEPITSNELLITSSPQGGDSNTFISGANSNYSPIDPFDDQVNYLVFYISYLGTNSGGTLSFDTVLK